MVFCVCCLVAGLRERIADGEFVIDAEGYLFEFERRGYLCAGAYVPEVCIDNPHLLNVMHEEFVHAGSDVVEAFTVALKPSNAMFQLIAP